LPRAGRHRATTNIKDYSNEENRMKISFDPKYGVIYLKFSEDKIANTIEADDFVLIDYGGSGQIIGIEILNASA
jgi:uncharacterized protein YuzE